MELEGICFNKNKTFAGTFQLPNGENVFGKLFYRKNEQCEFLIYRDGFSEELLNDDNEFLAILSDEKENISLEKFIPIIYAIYQIRIF